MKVEQSVLIFLLLLYILKRMIFFLVVVFVFFLGCNKIVDFEDLEFLIQKNWYFILRVQGGIDLIDDCDLDDVLVFMNVIDFDYDFGDLICGDSSFVKDVDIWKIIDDFIVLRMKYRFEGSGKGIIIEYWKIFEFNDILFLVEDVLVEGNDQVFEI